MKKIKPKIKLNHNIYIVVIDIHNIARDNDKLFVFAQVTILFSNFSEEDRALPDAVQYRREINEYNKRYSGVPRPVSSWIIK